MNPDTAESIARIEGQIDTLQDEIAAIERGSYDDRNRKTANRLLGSKLVRHGKPSPRFAGQSKGTIYSRIKELEQRLYIKRTEARGCPCVWFYKLNLTPYERK